MNAPAESNFILAPLDSIADGPNYRKRRPKDWEAGLDELAASMKEHGVIEPIVIRPFVAPVGHELTYQRVIGERRMLAARRAGLTEIPTIVRSLTDDQVLELQVAENNQRENPHPLDEAEGFAELVKRGRTPTEIADRLGRDVGYVAKRLALTRLSKACQKALDDEAITFGVALLLARIPISKLQDEALIDVAADKFDRAIMTVDEARRIIEENHMLSLADAPFDTKDALLIEKAGSCTLCPKRTGVQRELFDDVKSKDLCTDKTCFAAKSDALWQIRKKEAEKGGKKVLDGKAAQEAVRYGGSHVALDSEEWIGEKRTKVRKLFGKDLPETTLARGHDGRVLELVKREDFDKAVRVKHPKEAPTRSDDGRAAQKRAEAKQRVQRKAIRSAIAEAVEKVQEAKAHEVVELVVRAFAARVWNEVQRDVLERRVGLPKSGGYETAIVKLVKDMKNPVDVLGMGLELALRSGAPWHGGASDLGGSGLWRDGLKLVGVSFAKHEKAAKAETKKPKSGGHHWMPGNRNACGQRTKASVGEGASSHFGSSVTCKACIAFHGTERGQKLAREQEKKTAAALKKHAPKKRARK